MTLRWLLSTRRAIALFIGASTTALATGACLGTSPTNVQGCRNIEEARCRKAPGCNIDLDQPPHSGTSNDDKIEACIAWYDDACLHGFIAGDPGPTAIQSCVDAINGGDCNTVAHPETNSACVWLVPPDQRPPATDAGDSGK